MITNAIINIFFIVPLTLLSMLTPPTINFELPDNMFDIIRDITSGISYIVPIVALLPIFQIRISLAIAKIIIAFIVRVKSFIPTMGA